MSSASPQPPSLVGQLLGDWPLRVCGLFALAAALTPPDGLAVDLCWWHRATGTPCPGCGMTRCGSNLVRGDWQRAWSYHPLGLVLFPALLALGALALAPRRWRDAVRLRLERWDVVGRPLFWILALSFLIFGAVRWLAVWLGQAGFPSNLA